MTEAKARHAGRGGGTQICGMGGSREGFNGPSVVRGVIEI